MTSSMDVRVRDVMRESGSAGSAPHSWKESLVYEHWDVIAGMG